MEGVMDDTPGGNALRSQSAFRLRPLIALSLSLLCLALSLCLDTAAAEKPLSRTDPRQPPPIDINDEPEEEAEETDQLIVEIVVEGNTTIPASAVTKHVKSRVGRPPLAATIKEDVRALYGTKWFFSVDSLLRPTSEGVILVFRVQERPILKHVEFKAEHKLKKKELKELEGMTGLKSGGAFDVGANKEAARRIESYYQEKGYLFCEVKLVKGEFKDDRDAVFFIKRGSKVHVTKIAFEGNKFFWSDMLKTKVKSKTRKLWFFGGRYDPANVPEDVAALKEYYHSLGFFDVKILNNVKLSEDKSKVELSYKIEEGIRYKIRNVEIVGNQIISEADLRKDMKLLPNDFFVERKLNQDVEKVTNQYGETGRIFAVIDAKPRYYEEPGVIDLVYSIDEDRPYRIRRVNVHINGEHPHTKESVVINRMLIKPGDLANPTLIKKSERRIGGSQVFAGAQPGHPDSPRIQVAKGDGLDRTQSHIVRAQGLQEEGAPPGQTINPDDPLSDPLGQSLTEPPPGWVDVDVNVAEAQTGRLMFGVGVNSNAGVVGSIVLDENNFDITRIPTSTQDITDGTAFRGGGQQFRMEAVPGTQLSRYSISWRDPYFLDRDISFGVSGSYYNRYFPDWLERRAGGRVTLGKQFTPYLSATMAVRVEDVNISQPTTPTPQQLQDVVGSNFLSTVRLSVAHDTRDTAFLPGTGHFIEVGYEQGMADFVYPRVDLDARQYFTLSERPDGSGRNILSLSGQLGYEGSETPLFEHYFAGGFQSFRGFAFYGVTPRELGVRVGGTFQALGSAEYMVPVTADDTIQLVGFTDFGTVDDSVTLENFRVSVGGGVRLTIPAMGPAPIALDFSVPLLKQDMDTTQLFAFYVGVLR